MDDSENDSSPDYPSLNESSYSYYWDGYPIPRQIGVGSTISFMILVTTVGNLMVMTAFYRDRRISSNIANWYILNMSVADFIVGSFILVLSIIWSLKGWWLFGEHLCKIYLYVDSVAVTVPVGTILCISLDRYYLLTKGLKYSKYATKSKAVALITTMWLFCAIYFGVVTYAWIPMTGFEEEIDYSWNCESEATYFFPFQVFSIIAFFFVPLVLIAGLNMVVYSNIYRRSRGFQSKATATLATSTKADTKSETSRDIESISISIQQKSEEKKAARDKKKVEFSRHRKAAITLAVLVGVFIVCWLPYYIAVLFSASCGECVHHQVWSAMSYMLWGNSMINPLLYAAMNVHFRRNFIQLMGLERLTKGSIEQSKTMSTSG